MTDSLSHRGPDGCGVWVDEVAGVAFGQRRLAIIDLSDAGSQPMVSGDGRMIVTFNGEIYNANDLRRDLDSNGVRFRGSSDTEVLIEACAAWGVRGTLDRLNGMFAFAVWDRRERTLFLARDRLGIKPLYWTRKGGHLLFGSELKALIANPSWSPELDLSSLASYFRHSYVLGPRTIYRQVEQLAPGHLITIQPEREPKIEKFWDLRTVAFAARRDDLSAGEAADQLEDLLHDSISRQMIADVPLGALLSGGIDSSTVVALMQAKSTRPIRTFSIGFPEASFDEAQHAKAIASHLGTEHTELYLDPKQALDVIPHLADIYDEPFADSSQIATYLVSALTRQHVSVALSGDGGDEIFGGYNRYLWAKQLYRRLRYLPKTLRQAIGGMIKSVSPSSWDNVANLLPGTNIPPQFGDKLHKLANAVQFHNADSLYRSLISYWPEPEKMVPGAVEPRGVIWSDELSSEFPDFVDRMQILDTLTYLPDDVLTKVDRASMAVGLEVRVPLLDHRVVEFGWQLPQSLKVQGGLGKWLLRQVLYRHVPKHLVDRPKMGFGVPIADWLRGPLREWAEDMLDEAYLRRQGILNPVAIRQKWREHLTGTRNWQYHLWGVLMFQTWHERWIGARV